MNSRRISVMSPAAASLSIGLRSISSNGSMDEVGASSSTLTDAVSGPNDHGSG